MDQNSDKSPAVKPSVLEGADHVLDMGASLLEAMPRLGLERRALPNTLMVFSRQGFTV